MKKLITTAIATMVAFYGYSQDGTHLPLIGGTLAGNLTLSSGSSKSIGWGGHTSAGAVYPLIYSDHSFLALNSKIGGRLYFNFDNNDAGSLVDFFNGKLTVNKDGELTGTSAAFAGPLSFSGGASIIDNWGYTQIRDNLKNPRIWFGPQSDPRTIYDLATNSSSHIFRRLDGAPIVEFLGTDVAAKFYGPLYIGTLQTSANLYVNGTVNAKEVKVEASIAVPDYVFEKSYDLQSLSEVENYIAKNKHLPEIPSAKEITKDGINLGEMQMKLLQKIEELTLHLIEQDKKNASQQKEIEELRSRLDR